MRYYDKRIMDKRAKAWILYDRIANTFSVFENLFSMIAMLIWKQKTLASATIVDTVIVNNTELLTAMCSNIELEYLETCLESEV